MRESAIAVKAFIIRTGSLLLIKRSKNDLHKPETWDIPGGRLELLEDPYHGLKREVKEEINSEVDINIPLDVQHFTRDDKQVITMLIFLCTLKKGIIVLSEEHDRYEWVPIHALEKIPEWLHPVIDNYTTYIKQV